MAPLLAPLRCARRVAVLGVGSDLRGDDVAGVLVARRLAAWAARAGREDVLALQAGAAPENFTGEIVKFAPDLVVLVDAAHLRAPPGTIQAIEPDRVGGLAFSTHMLPVPILLDYLTRRTGCRALVLGIQLGRKDVLGKVTPEVQRAVRRLASALRRAIEDRRPEPAASPAVT